MMRAMEKMERLRLAEFRKRQNEYERAIARALAVFDAESEQQRVFAQAEATVEAAMRAKARIDAAAERKIAAIRKGQRESVARLELGKLVERRKAAAMGYVTARKAVEKAAREDPQFVDIARAASALDWVRRKEALEACKGRDESA